MTPAEKPSATPSSPSNAAPPWRVRLIRGAIAMTALAAGAAVLTALIATKPQPAREEHAAAPVTVRAMTARAVPVAREFRGYAVARAVDVANVSAEIEGVVVDKPDEIKEGARVDRGQPLVTIDPSDYEARAEALERTIQGLRAQLAQLDIEAEAAREQAELAAEAAEAIDREIARLRDAAERGAATENEIDRQIRNRIAVVRERVTARERLASIPPRRAQLEAQIAATQADLAQAERNLERTAVLAPIAGILQSVDVEVGERVAAGRLIARVVDASRIEAPLRLPLGAAATVRVGDPATLTADGPENGVWEGRVVRLAPEADPATRTITVFVEATQDVPDGRAPSLMPGRFVLGTVSVGEDRPRVIVPRGAVAEDRVMVVTGADRVQSRRVDVAYYIESSRPELVEGETQWAVLESGLEPGETVAISGLAKLRPGMSVLAVIGSSEAATATARTADENRPEADR